MSASIIGQVLLNRYRVEQYIASGGMGSVFKVWDMERSVPLAMKTLHSDLAEDPAIFRRFEREARALKNLAHPNIVRFYGLFQAEDLSFILEQYIDGPTLKQVLRSAPGQMLPVSTALIYMKFICAALGYAHNYGVVHCDIKPGNIMIDPGGVIFLTDFGIARHAESTTTTMGSAGTPAYMAPEQIRGDPVTAATDIYALGVLLFEALTGQRPFMGTESYPAEAGTTSGERIRYAHLNRQPPDPRSLNPQIPPRLAQVILKALEKDPQRRFSSAQQMYAAACQAAGVDPGAVPDRLPPMDVASVVKPAAPVERATPQPPVQPAQKSRRGLTIAGMLGAAALLVIIFLVMAQGGTRPPQPPPQTIVGPADTTNTPTSPISPTSGPNPGPVEPPGGEPTTPRPSDTPVIEVPPTAAPTGTSEPTLAPPTATPRRQSAVVAWDVSHGPRESSDGGLYDPSGLYSQLASMLGQNNIRLELFNGSLDSLDPAQYQAVVIGDMSAVASRYSNSDADAVRRFAGQGGGVLILGEKSSLENNVGVIAASFGVQTGLDPEIDAVSQLTGHTINQGVGQLQFLFGGGAVSGDDSYVTARAGGAAAIMAIDNLPGRMVVIGDTNLFDNRGLTQANNERFALNVFRWITLLE